MASCIGKKDWPSYLIEPKLLMNVQEKHLEKWVGRVERPGEGYEKYETYAYL